MNIRHRSILHGAAAFVAVLCAACGSSTPVNAGSGSSGGGGSGSSSGGASAAAAIKVLSNRADLLSGGDALVEVVLPAGAKTSEVSVQLNGRDVTQAFALRASGRYLGRVSGMNVGSNTLSASGAGLDGSSATLVNHPNGGPIFSGPQLQPWPCQPAAVDAQCNQPPVYSWLYMSSNPLNVGLQPYDPANPASDVATTTTDQGVSLPFIVRVETGYQDRDQYAIATLFQPGQDWQPWAAQKQWNHKLLITGGFSCGVIYGVSNVPSLTVDYGGTLATGIPAIDTVQGNSPVIALGRGFAVMATALDHDGQNCNIVTQAESLVMAKEHLVETYGELRYTIGTGCSGGSLLQQQVANAYPGIYQGILPQCSFPDAWSTATEIGDFHLLNTYFNNPSGWGSGVLWTPLQEAAVEGNLLPLDSSLSDTAFFSVVYPTNPCQGVTDTQRYDAVKNPGGVRCGLPDFDLAFLGPRLPAVWTANEKKLGHGFAGLPIDNVGVQYGLSSLQQGLITPDMFLDLNARIGGVDIDINPTKARIAADEPALTNIYRSGAINEANNLKDVAIIDLRGPDPGIAHDAYRSWEVRARLQRAQGNYDNDVIWFGAVPLIGDTTYTTQGLLAMDRWLAEVEKDLRDVPLARKIVDDKPGDIQDRCTQVQGLSTQDGFFLPLVGALADPILGPLLNPILNPVLSPATGLIVDPVSNLVCGIPLVQTAVQTRFATPRMVAGDAITTDANKCQLKPLNRSDNYGVVAFSDAQWAQMQTLYPQGVCDYSVPAVDQQPTIAWQTYQDGGGAAVYGGKAMPAAPANSGSGWASPAFEPFSSGL